MKNEELWLYAYEFPDYPDLIEFVNNSGLKMHDIQSIVVNPEGNYVLFLWMN